MTNADFLLQLLNSGEFRCEGQLLADEAGHKEPVKPPPNVAVEAQVDSSGLETESTDGGLPDVIRLVGEGNSYTLTGSRVSDVLLTAEPYSGETGGADLVQYRLTGDFVVDDKAKTIVYEVGKSEICENGVWKEQDLEGGIRYQVTRLSYPGETWLLELFGDAAEESVSAGIQIFTGKETLVPYVGIALAGLLFGVVLTLLIRRLLRLKKPRKTVVGALRTGMIQNQGDRPEQQDSCCVSPYPGGVLAVVSDGMGGLENGGTVSRQVVASMIRDSAALTSQNSSGQLSVLLSRAVGEVNAKLGPKGLYKSGATVVAVLAEKERFQWISVGDSRIYLWRAGVLMQLNREHTYLSELMQAAVNQKISFASALSDQTGDRLTSFVGMGALKYVDSPEGPTDTAPGDRLILMSDGIYKTLSDEEIGGILEKNEDPQNAANELESLVLARRKPKQDNFTAIVLNI